MDISIGINGVAIRVTDIIIPGKCIEFRSGSNGTGFGPSTP